MKRRLLALPILGWGLSRPLFAVQAPEVTLEFIQTAHLSSFSTLMLITVKNETYMPLNLVDQAASSELLIDGKSFPRKDVPFEGPPGLRAMSHWEACVPVGDYADSILPGKHRMVLKMGGGQSSEVSVEWRKPVNWRQGNLKTRMKEVEDMAAAIKKGLPRSCVEEWMPVKDDGEQEEHQVRYFLEPFIKVLVPYTQEGGSGRDEDIVSGPAKVYQENRFRD